MVEDRRPTCFLHIGPHKTGSSSIKHFAIAHQETLLSSGLFFPLLPGKAGAPTGAHHQLVAADAIARDGTLKAGARLWPEVEAVAARGETDILLSSEMLCKALADERTFGRLLAYFERRGYRVRVLAYVRDQPAWLNSWYVQSQKRFSALMSFDEFCAGMDRDGRVDPWRYLKPFVDNPRCDLEIIPFERAARAGLEKDFIRRCGATAPPAQNARRNPNAGARSVHAAQEVMRRFGPGIQSIPDYQSVSQKFKQRYIDYGWEEPPYSALTEENVARIRARYAAGNERFARAFFGASWDEVCPAQPFATSLFDPASASLLERWRIERLVRSTVAKFRRLKAQTDLEAKRSGRVA